MPTLQQYRQALASSRDLPGYMSFTATGTSASASAAQEIISSSLADDTPNASSRYGGMWVYGTTDGAPDTLSGIQRQVRPFGFDGSTGTLTVTRAFGSTPASGASWEMYRLIPAIRSDDGRDGYREIINDALRQVGVVDRLSIVGVSGQTRYTLNLSQYPWLREHGRILNLWRPTPNADDLERVDPQFWTIVPDGESLVLQTPSAYLTGDVFKLEVFRPANSRLKTSGAWTDQGSPVAGLSADTDEAIPAINDLVLVARELAFLSIAEHGPQAETDGWMRKAGLAARQAASVRFSRQFGAPPYGRATPFVGAGGLSAWR